MKDYKIGDTYEIEVITDESMQAKFEGKLIHNLYSTWSLVYHAELASRRLLEKYLKENEEGIGYSIFVKHLAPTKIGKKVKIIAILRSVEGNKFICDIEGYNEDGKKIAEGYQIQVFMDKEELKRKLEL
ncbi:MAG: thioesterase family protein [candidate division WOR-3 bacterium]|nr:thioesterase family protein [candidate division WOR-3 bacterium]MCX7947334.1 thioesterase family protein [candidate division WOR-3 bacterium]MDW8150110.1 thioesterase family protein [candidate division WOR-3 bacterium]